MAKNEKTSARVSKIAAKVLAIKCISKDFVLITKDGAGIVVRWSDVRALAASALTQAPDKRDIEAARKYLYNDLGFDPRESGKVGKQSVSKRKRVLSARIKSKRPSSWPPSAKPGRNSA